MKMLVKLASYLFLCLLLLYGSTVLAQPTSKSPGFSQFGSFRWEQLYMEIFDTEDPATLQRLQKWLVLGQDGNWNGRVDRRAYQLFNQNGPNDVKYFYTSIGNKGLSDAFVSVDIYSDFRYGTNVSGSGLIYRFNKNHGNYYALVLQNHNKITLYKKDANGFQAIFSEYAIGIRPRAYNRLGIFSRPNNLFEIHLNQEKIAEITRKDAGFESGIVGLIAMSTGFFAYANFSVSKPVYSDALPPQPKKSAMKGYQDKSSQAQQYLQKPPKKYASVQPKKAQRPSAKEIILSRGDIAMAKQVIQANTRSLPGFGVGKTIKVGSGDFSAADALVLYLLKFHKQNRICPPVAVVAQTLHRIRDSNFAKKAVSVFWKDYSTTSDIDRSIAKSNATQESFEWYILTKTTEKLKITNMRFRGLVGADESWRRAMQAQQSHWEKSRQREDEFILKRGAYRVVLDAQAAVAAAERVMASGY